MNPTRVADSDPTSADFLDLTSLNNVHSHHTVKKEAFGPTRVNRSITLIDRGLVQADEPKTTKKCIKRRNYNVYRIL
jgi:hypothetical protein